jgi:glycolate oxidase FAD binding subunit
VALGHWLIDWGGAQRYLRTEAVRTELEHASGGGHVSCLRAARDGESFAQEPQPALKALHLRLKHAFDPARVLNPGRLYGWL